ncbi:MAG: protein-L-isoaspartate(D-aspartate) O-methyltransferase [Fidelibacterota bacterium]
MTENQDSGKLNMYFTQRRRMVEEQIKARGIHNERVLKAMRTVPRHQFVDDQDRDWAYGDHPIPIGQGQTVSQPYIVAFMTDMLKITKRHKVLEIGTGSGYQTAVLAQLAGEVISIEIIPSLAESARQKLEKLGYKNIRIFTGDGKRGWLPEAPYHRIIGTAAPRKIPATLTEQLTNSGRMVLPIGRLITGQYLQIITKDNQGKLNSNRSLPVRFVPMV